MLSFQDDFKDPCCWDCIKCKDNAILSKNLKSCIQCEDFYWPSKKNNHTTCELIETKIIGNPMEIFSLMEVLFGICFSICDILILALLISFRKSVAVAPLNFSLSCLIIIGVGKFKTK